MTDERTRPEPTQELEELRARLAEAEETLRAIRTGDVDAVVVCGARGEQVYTLNGAESVYRQLVETMSEGAVTLSTDGVILYCNVRLAKMLGRPLDRVLGTALRNYLSPADEQALDVILAQARTAPSRREICLKSSDGRLVPAYLSASRLHSEGAKTVFCLVFTDLTDQKSHEQIVAAKGELQTAKAFLDGVIKAIADPIFVKDDKRRFVVVNDALCAIVGRSREALLGEDGDDMFPSDQVAVFRKMDAAVLETGAENLNEESLSDLSTKEVRTIVTRKSRYIDSAGKRFLVGAIRDITERKRAEEELLRDSERQAALNALLGLSLEAGTLKGFLSRVLNLTISLKWLGIESKGAIFLADDEGKTLQLQAQENFPKDLLAVCSAVPFGRCLCGRAAAERAVQFADRVDDRHEVGYPGILPHGHYCVPILSGDRVLGVITLYVKEGHVWSSWEEVFLKAVAVALAGVIERKQAEAQIAGQLVELQRWQEVMLGREDRVQELKREVNECRHRAGEPIVYLSQETVSAGSEAEKAGT